MEANLVNPLRSFIAMGEKFMHKKFQVRPAFRERVYDVHAQRVSIRL